MPTYLLDEELWFPPLEEQEDEVIAVGGDLSPERLLLAYKNGVFPWYNEPGQIWWWNPFERCVLYCKEVKVSHSMRNTFNKGHFTFTFDHAFPAVVEGCRGGDRKDATWIHDEVFDSYCKLHELGFAHSAEVWENGVLVGGLYGVSLGKMFFGESMFSIKPNSSKAAFIFLARKLSALGFSMIDCQVHSEHLASMGAQVMKRNDFLAVLAIEKEKEGFYGKWNTLPEFSNEDFKPSQTDG